MDHILAAGPVPPEWTAARLRRFDATAQMAGLWRQKTRRWTFVSSSSHVLSCDLAAEATPSPACSLLLSCPLSPSSLVPPPAFKIPSLEFIPEITAPQI